MTEQKTKFDEVTRKQVQQVSQVNHEASTKLSSLDLKFETFSTPSLVGFAFLAWMLIGCSANAPTESKPVTPAAETTPNGTPADPQPIESVSENTEPETKSEPRDTMEEAGATLAKSLYLSQSIDEFSIIAVIIGSPPPTSTDKVVDGKSLKVLDFDGNKIAFVQDDNNQFRLAFLMNKGDETAMFPPAPNGLQTDGVAQRQSAYQRGLDTGRRFAQDSIGQMVQTIGGRIKDGDASSEAVIRSAKEDFNAWRRKVLDLLPSGQSDSLTEFAGVCSGYYSACKSHGINVLK